MTTMIDFAVKPSAGEAISGGSQHHSTWLQVPLGNCDMKSDYPSPPALEQPLVAGPCLKSVNINTDKIIEGVNRVSEDSVGLDDFPFGKTREKSSIDSPKEDVDDKTSVTYSCQKSELDDKQESTRIGSSSDHYIQRNTPLGGNIGSNSHGNVSNHNHVRRGYVRAPRFCNDSPHFNPTFAHRPPFYGGQGRGHVRFPEQNFGTSIYPPLPLPIPLPPHVMRPHNFPRMQNMIPCPDFNYNSAMPCRPPLPTPANIHYPESVYHDPMELKIVKQINYYFSKCNLVKDMFLRSKMDGEGWVSISVIASFPRVKELTESIPLILKSLTSSYVVEVQGDKIRRRYNWRTWVPPHLLASSSVDEPAAVHASS